MPPKKSRLQKYIKNTDEFLRKGMELIQSAFGIHRNVWQILHSVHEKGCIHINDLKRIMLPYADPLTVNGILAKLKITCVIFNAEDKITLTSNGIELYRNYLKVR
jgi:hypothetical protein